MDCCTPKEPMPGLKEEAPEGKRKTILAAILLVVLLGGIILYFLL